MPVLPSLLVLSLLVLAGPAHAHASEQALVLLLPTQVYTAAGVATVVATVLLLALVPGRVLDRLFRPVALVRLREASGVQAVTSGLSVLILLFALWAGVTGSHDPTDNPLPLLIWTGFWIAAVAVQGVVGDVWRWINPWAGPLWLARRLGWRAPASLRSETWPGIVTFLAFAAFLLADPAPTDPDRLAVAVGLYWLATFVLALAFGPGWLHRGEGLTLALTAYARVAVLGPRDGRLQAGLPGWQVAGGRLAPGMALLAVLMLGTGSFDGMNETFWWLGVLGMNPFEFGGRSAVVWQTLAGIVAANLLLVAVLAGSLWLGLRIARQEMPLRRAFVTFAPTLLPIALGYHLAHYLTAFLVDGQYLLEALSDPFHSGADWLGLGPHFVSTGFFNTTASVRLIFLTQAGAVVGGHVLAVLLAHVLAVRAFGSGGRAALSQAPLALFMIAYTLFGLWLLSSPRF